MPEKYLTAASRGAFTLIPDHVDLGGVRSSNLIIICMQNEVVEIIINMADFVVMEIGLRDSFSHFRSVYTTDLAKD